MEDPKNRSGEATALLNRLQRGEDIGELKVYPSSGAGFDHAAAFLSNAYDLSKVGGASDFQVFGVLYGLRHGLELFLKCLLQNQTIDDLLDVISRGTSLRGLFKWLALKNERDSKNQKGQLLRALSVLRNVEVDQLTFPACWSENQATACKLQFAHDGLRFIQEHGAQPRSTFATLWVPSFGTHNLLRVFRRVEPCLTKMERAATVNGERTGAGRPIPVSTIAATCELFEQWDPNGHAIRYPTSSGAKSSVSISGWNNHLPHLSVRALGKLSDELHWTVNSYDALLTDCYTRAKLRSPHPSYESFLY